MALERELKLRLSHAVAQALPEHPLLRLGAAPRRRSLHTLYFDTEALELGAAGLVLRLRDSGDARLITVKARGADALGAARREWEWQALDSASGRLGPRDLEQALRSTALGAWAAAADCCNPAGSPHRATAPSSGEPSLDAAASPRRPRPAPISPISRRQPPPPTVAEGAAQALQGLLAPRFQTRFERCAWILDWPGARFEVALDRGACLAWRDGVELRAPLCELEIEVLDGELAHAWDLAWTLAQDHALLLSPIDKARRAVALLRGERLPVLPEPGALAQDASLEQAARAWLQVACAQLAVWAERIAEDDDAHDIHQFRVVLRRLRTALRWLAPHLPRDAAPWLRGELRWAHQLAGLVRDADVALQRLRDVGAANARAAAQARRLAADIERARTRHRSAMQAYAQSARFGRLLLALGRCGECAIAGAGSGALRRMAQRALRRDRRAWRDALGDCEAWFGAAQPELPRLRQALRLHRLRIASKRLRLSAERMAGLLPHKARQRFAHAGKLATALQGHLGDWHDAERLLQVLRERAAAAPQLRRELEQQARASLRQAGHSARQALAGERRDQPPAGVPAAPVVPAAPDAAAPEAAALPEPAAGGPELDAPRVDAHSVEAPDAAEASTQAPSAAAAMPVSTLAAMYPAR